MKKIIVILIILFAAGLVVYFTQQDKFVTPGATKSCGRCQGGKEGAIKVEEPKEEPKPVLKEEAEAPKAEEAKPADPAPAEAKPADPAPAEAEAAQVEPAAAEAQ